MRHGRKVERANLGAGFLVRMIVLACVAVVGSAWGLVRFYTRVSPAMVVRVAGDAAAGGWDAGEGTVEIEVEGR